MTIVAPRERPASETGVRPAFGAYLKDLCVAADLGSPNNLARLIGVAESTVSRVVSGRSVPSVETLRRYAETLDVPLINLVIASGLMTIDELAEKDVEEIQNIRASLADDTVPAEERDILLAMIANAHGHWRDLRRVRAVRAGR